MRPAWRPIIGTASSLVGSKFSGTPWMPEGKPWPVCGQCGAFMPLMLQLNLSSLPSELGNQFGAGLLQLFYCQNAEDDKCPHDGSAFVSWQLVRVITSDGIAKQPDIPQLPTTFPEKMIVGWNRVTDYPNRLQLKEFGIWEQGPCGDDWITLPSLGLRLEMDYDEFEPFQEKCRSSDKLAGWPDWLQPFGDHWPKCPRCLDPMTNHVFQLEEGDHLPHIFKWADGARGHVLQCPRHSDVVTFQWDSG